MNNKLKIMLSLILALTLVMGGVASAASMVFYDATDKVIYNDDMTDLQMDALVAAAIKGNDLAKVVNGKLINYAAYKAAIVQILVNAKLAGKTDAEAIALVVAQQAAIVAGLPAVTVDSGLTVVSVTAINPTSIKVTFSADPKPADLVNTNFTLSKGTVDGVTATGKDAIVSVSGLTYGDVTTLTVVSPAYSKAVTIPVVADLYTLLVQTDATNDTIKANGASKTQLTVQLIENATGLVVDRDGIIQFQATDGGLGQTTSALIDGKASVQLTSIASPVSVTSIVTATVSDVPGAQEFKGLTAQKAVIFSPEGEEAPGSLKFVTAKSVESTQGDRFFVVFSDKITAVNYKAAYNDFTVARKAASGYGVMVNGRYVNIKNVVQKTDYALEFILDTDLATEARFDTFTHTRIEAGWSYAGTLATLKNYLRDNVQHKVEFPANIGSLVLASAPIPFILTDTSKPAVLGVSAKDQIEFEVRFTESVDERTVEQLTAGIAANFSLDGKQVVVNAAPTVGDILTAKTNNRVIATVLKVGVHNSATDDTRNIVTFRMHPEFALANGTHTIQIARITDWAGDVDPVQNTVVTDTFSFEVNGDITKPVATILVQSPEQWFVTYDKPIVTATSKVARDVFKIKTGNAADAELIYGQDFEIYVTDKNGVAGRKLAPTAKINGDQYFLIEMMHDWSIQYNTKTNTSKTYFASTQNPYIVTLEHVQSLIGNASNKQDLLVNLGYDSTSPKVVDAIDVFSTTDKKYLTNVLSAANKPVESAEILASGQIVYVSFTEPIKVNSDGVAGAGIIPAEGLTASQDQFTNTGIAPATTGANLIPQGTAAVSQGNLNNNKQAVQASTYEFKKGNKIIKAEVLEDSLAANDYSFVLKPVTQLEAGEWILTIRALTDDVGNALATEQVVVIVEPQLVGDTATQVAWAAFDDAKGNGKLVDIVQYDTVANGEFDVIYVKFTKEMKADGANGVASSQNYVFRGQPLSVLGSNVQILRGIKGVTKDWDGVTIIMPKDTWNGLAPGTSGVMGTADIPQDNFTAAFNVADNFVSAIGAEKISGAKEFELTDTATAFQGFNSLPNGFEAVYKNTLGTLAGVAVLEAIATEGTVATINGKIDRITLLLNEPATVAPNTVIYVNGVKFTSLGGLVFNSTTDEVPGTTTGNLVITSEDGSILINRESVIDNVSPVVKSAQLAGSKLKVTYSEDIDIIVSPVVFATHLAVVDSLGAPVALTVANAEEVGSDYLVFNITTGTIPAGSTIDATPGSNFTDKATNKFGFAIPNTVAEIEQAAFANDVKINGISGGGGTILTGATATGYSSTNAGVAGVLATPTTWSVVTGTPANPAVFTNVNSKLKGYNIVFATGTANGAALVGNTFTVTLIAAGDTATNVLAILKAAGGVTSGTDVATALAALTVTNGTETITPATAAVTYTAGITAVTPVFALGEFKVTSGATKTGNVTVTLTETMPKVEAPATIAPAAAANNVYVGTVAVVAGMTKEEVAEEIGTNATWAPALGNVTVTWVSGDTVIITQTTAERPVTYTVTVE